MKRNLGTGLLIRAKKLSLCPKNASVLTFDELLRKIFLS